MRDEMPMATRGVSPEERAIIEEMQRDMEAVKKRLAQYERGAQKIFAMAQEAGPIVLGGGGR